MYARLIDFRYGIFLRMTATKVVVAATDHAGDRCVQRVGHAPAGLLDRKAVAFLRSSRRYEKRKFGLRLLTLRILIGKTALSFLAILGGFAIGMKVRPVHVRAALMFSLAPLFERPCSICTRHRGSKVRNDASDTQESHNVNSPHCMMWHL
ncbi:hypothetical protein [Paraburkholderia sp. D15]|uniref:hypothetical protein n=1 Tax=Paraburkholderia sp. D15 TaxID=2880218 RepID=UPI0032B056DC